MDRATLIAAMGNDVISDAECAAFNEALTRSRCTTVDRAAMFCAQIGHESVGLRYYAEIFDRNNPSRDQRTYAWRMGNNGPDDGYRYRGSGPLQVTGKDNFGALSRWAYGMGYVSSPTYFVDRPDDLRSVHYGFLGAVWYWTDARNMNGFADRGDIYGASVAVNGGENGLTDRTNRWNRCRAMGAALLPTPTEEIDMAAKEEIIKFIETYLGPVISDVKDIREQLVGSRDLIRKDDGSIDFKASFKGWSQLGKNERGENFTVVDSLADTRKRVIALEATVAKLTGGGK